MERIAEGSPRFKARIAGLFYLLTMLTRMFVEIFVRNRLVVSDDPAATATNILAHEPLWRWSFAADIIAFASYVALTFPLLRIVYAGEPERLFGRSVFQPRGMRCSGC
jgi:Domain of unknown function (DUF4386)